MNQFCDAVKYCADTYYRTEVDTMLIALGSFICVLCIVAFLLYRVGKS